jgi:nucleoside-diphosphate kinase
LAQERTLFIVKPDAVERQLIGKILAHVEERGFRIVEARFVRLTREEAQTFYAEHNARPFFNDLVDYMTSGPVMLTCLEGEGGVAKLREVVGATDPASGAGHRASAVRAEQAGELRTRLGQPGQRRARAQAVLRRRGADPLNHASGDRPSVIARPAQVVELAWGSSGRRDPRACARVP